jgi:hypothetical protein
MKLTQGMCQSNYRSDAVALASKGVNKPALERVLALVNDR